MPSKCKKKTAGKTSKQKKPGKTEKDRAKKIIRLLKEEYPKAKTALSHKDPLQLLVATILSAQCTDERVNKVTKELFKEYKTAEDYADANPDHLKEMIHSTGFYNNKAKNIMGMAQKVVSDYDGEVPDNMKELLTLPGVARKTANVVLGSAFDKTEGVVVDTHVKRLSQRLGLTQQKNPDKIERDLMEVAPKEDWIWFAHALIRHGRRVCKARKPACGECLLNEVCPCAFNFD